MTSKKINYLGDVKLAKAWGNVVLTNSDMTLRTDTLRLDREKQEAFYQDEETKSLMKEMWNKSKDNSRKLN